MRNTRVWLLAALGGIAAPMIVTLVMYESRWAALLATKLPWFNWSIYVLGALCGALLAVLGGYFVRSYWLLLAALGSFYWALGCMIGALQTGENPTIAPAVALPYIRVFWLMGGTALMVGTVGVLAQVVRIVNNSSGSCEKPLLNKNAEGRHV